MAADVENSEVIVTFCVLVRVGSSVTIVEVEVVVDEFSDVVEEEVVSGSLLVDTGTVVEVVCSVVELSVDKVVVSPGPVVENVGCSVIVE